MVGLVLHLTVCTANYNILHRGSENHVRFLCWREYITVVVGFFIAVLPVLYTLGDSPKLLADRRRHKEAMKALSTWPRPKEQMIVPVP